MMWCGGAVPCGADLIEPSLFLHQPFVIQGQPWGMRTTNALATMDPSAETVDRPRRTVWTVLSGCLGGIVGLAPHVLHHIGPLVGTALVAGAGGTALFGFLGLLASVPMLIKLRRRFSNWWAPAIALSAFTAMFLISSYVVGPLISTSNDPARPGSSEVNHIAHHS
jgi:hypothetical protein